MSNHQMNVVLYSTLVVLLLVLALPTHARMYQWDNPDTGRTHLSGAPPAWYRTETEGPRVFVFEGGQLVDDTGVSVSDDKRRALRRKALVESADKTNQAQQRAGQSAPIQQGGKPAMPTGSPPAVAKPDALEMPPPVTENLNADEDDEDSGLTAEEVAQMRALVSEWESRNRVDNQRRVKSLNADDTGSADSKPSVSREQVLEYIESRRSESKAQDD